MNSFHSDDNVRGLIDGGMEGGGEMAGWEGDKGTKFKKKNLGWLWRGNTEEKETLQIQTPLHFSEVLSTVPSILFLLFHIILHVLFLIFFRICFVIICTVLHVIDVIIFGLLFYLDLLFIIIFFVCFSLFERFGRFTEDNPLQVM